jgi:putative redox protein
MITGRRKEKLVAEITTGSDVTHTIIADVAQKFGGSDLGPDPHDFFEASLAACTIITVQMYAERHGWKLDSTDVKINIDKEGAKSHLVREISFRGDLTQEQIARLLEIADKCPIHRLMTSDISISTSLAEKTL